MDDVKTERKIKYNSLSIIVLGLIGLSGAITNIIYGINNLFAYLVIVLGLTAGCLAIFTFVVDDFFYVEELTTDFEILSETDSLIIKYDKEIFEFNSFAASKFSETNTLICRIYYTIYGIKTSKSLIIGKEEVRPK